MKNCSTKWGGDNPTLNSLYNDIRGIKCHKCGSASKAGKTISQPVTRQIDKFKKVVNQLAAEKPRRNTNTQSGETSV